MEQEIFQANHSELAKEVEIVMMIDKYGDKGNEFEELEQVEKDLEAVNTELAGALSSLNQKSG